MDPEHIKSTVNAYLKRRRFSGLQQTAKNECPAPSTQSAHQMAIRAIIDKDLTRSNSITYSNIVNESAQVDQQFSRLKGWIADIKIDAHRYELATILCPLFCHLYLEMLSGSHRGTALKFFKRHQALFASRENSRELLAALATITSTEDIEHNSLIKSFRSAKFHLKLSSQSLITLQRYLSHFGHVLILQTVQKWFDLEIIHPSEHDKEVDDLNKMTALKCDLKEGKSTKEETSTSVSGSSGSKGLEEVLKAIKGVRDSPSPLLLYAITDPDHKALCCNTTDSVSMLAVGVGNFIKLWGLTEKLKVPGKASTVSLATGQKPSTSYSSTTVRKCFLSPGTSPEHVASPSKNINSAGASLYGHSGAINGVAFVPNCEDPGLVLSVSQDTTMRSWRLDNYDNIAVYRGHSEEIWCLDVGSLGLYVITGSHDRTVRLWSLERNFPLRICAGHLLDVECLSFHPNNLYFASGSADETVRMWSVNDAKLLRLFPGHRGAIHAVAFSPDGKCIASAGEDRKLKIWDLAGGKLLKECKGHTNTIKAISWSRNSENIASCSLDGTVRLWSLKNKTSESSDSVAALEQLQSFTIGKPLLSVTHSKSDNLVCFGTA